MNRTTDICIAGGGPAGLAAALALNQEGFEVTVVDCAVPPIDKACGEGLLPDSIAALGRLGVILPPAIGHPIKGIRFSNAQSSVAADFPNGSGMGLRRPVLHSLLIERASAVGIRLVWGAKNVRLAGNGLAVNGGVIGARFVAGCDGQRSPIRTQAGLDAVTAERRRYAFRRHYRIAPWSDYVELYWGPRGQLYITPIASGEVCAAFISRKPKLRLEEALLDFPAVAARLDGVPHGSHEMGALSISRKLKRVYRDGLALLGDASGSVDAITGEGLCLAFKQAGALAAALKSDDLRAYQRHHEQIAARPHLLSSLMLTMEWHADVQRRALASLAKRPALFESLLKVHVGDAPFGDLVSWRLLGFGLDFIAA